MAEVVKQLLEKQGIMSSSTGSATVTLALRIVVVETSLGLGTRMTLVMTLLIKKLHAFGQ